MVIHNPLLSLQTHSYLIKEEPGPFAVWHQVYSIFFLQAFMIYGHLPGCVHWKKEKN